MLNQFLFHFLIFNYQEIVIEFLILQKLIIDK